jgi:TIR domain
MSDILLASLPGEAARVAPLAAGLRAAGLSVWWDADLAAGEDRQQVIAEKLAAARCVIAVWTVASVGPAGALVQDVAARALARRVLLSLPSRTRAARRPGGT